MARIKLWNNGEKNADYRFFDRTISEFMNASGTGVYVHLYQGTYGQDGNPDLSVLQIQDVVFQENRDRKYSADIYELRGTYNVQDQDFDLKQFGLFLTGDTVFIEFHTNDMLNLLGRRLMAGDVLELPHLRDDALLNEGKAINKFYVIEEATRATSGYSATWLSHIWRCKVTPMTAGTEYADILDKPNLDPFGLQTGDVLGDLLGTLSNDIALNTAIINEAIIDVKARNFETRQFYMVPPDNLKPDSPPWVFAGDGVPPNGALLIGSGECFPEDMPDGTYYLRTDYMPHALFRKQGSKWVMQELDYRRGEWTAASRLLEDFLNTTGTTTLSDGRQFSTQQALSKLMRPNPDFL